MNESSILKRILLACGHGRTRLFRQNAGTGWAGKAIRLKNGDMLIKNPYPFRAGVKGISDIIGWHTITITPEMIGRKLAIYTALEVKTKTGRIRKEQQTFINLVLAAGGLAGVVRSAEDAEDLLNEI